MVVAADQLSVAGTDRTAGAPAAPQPEIILTRTQMGENVGTTARAMLNFGLTRLRLAAPQCGWPNAKAVNAASGATRVLNDVTLHDDARAAVADLHGVYATTARPRDMSKAVLTGQAAAAEIGGRLARGERIGVLFGPERTGLENDEIALADAIVAIPLNPAFASLNLAQAVLLVAYELHQHRDTTPPRSDGYGDLEPASKAEIQALLEHVVAELEGTSFFRSDDRRAKRIQELELLFQRCGLYRIEVHTLRGLVKGLAEAKRPRGTRQSV